MSAIQPESHSPERAKPSGADPMATVAVLALLGLFVAITHRGFGFALLFLLAAPATGVAVGPVTLPDVFLIPALAVGVLSNVARLPRFAPAGLVVPGVVVLLAAIATARPGQDMLPAYLFAFSLVGVPLMLALHGTSPRRIRLMMGAFVIGASINAAVGIYDTVSAGFSMYDVTGFGGVRSAALTTHSNQLGLVSVLAVPLVMYLAQERRSWWLAMPVVVGGALCSGSRGAILGLGLAFVLATLIDRRPATSRMVAGLVAAVAAYFLAIRLGLGFGLERLAGDDSTAYVSDFQREQHAAQALADWNLHPWFGVGFGEAEAHNLYLELARSGGLVTLGAFVAWAGWMLWAGRDAIRGGSAQAPAALAMLVTWLLLAFQHNAVSVRFIFIPAGLVLACWLVCRNDKTAPSSEEDGAVARERGRSDPLLLP